MVVVDRRGDRLVQTVLALAVLGHVGIVVTQLDARTRREPLDRTHEIEVLHLAHERDRVTALLATEAVPSA